MKKKGITSDVGAMVILVVVLLILIYYIPPKIYKGAKSFFGLFGIGEAEASDKSILTKPLSDAELAFTKFINSYETCKKHSSDSCVCESFELATLPDGYSIKLEKLDGEKTRMTRIGLYGTKPTPEKVIVIDNDNLCLYQYDKPTRKFSEVSTNEITLDTKNNYPYKVANEVQLFRLDKLNTCFVSGTYETKLFDEITKSYSQCSLRKEGTSAAKTGMLDLSDYTGDHPYESFVKNKDDEASLIIENLRTFLINNIGKVTRITKPIGTAQGRLERRNNMFSDAYKNFDKNNDGFINEDVYFISIRGLSLQLENSEIKKDYFKLHYLQGSEQSRILAEKIKLRLQELNGKVIYNDKEVGLAEAPEEFKFDFETIKEENSQANTGPVFLTCTESYSDFIACKENTRIPTVFIDVVEVDGNGHYMFEGHPKSIAGKIYEGVKDYLS